MKSFIDMRKANLFYLGGVLLLMLTAIVLSNTSGVGAKSWIQGVTSSQVATWAPIVLFALSVGLGGFAAWSHLARNKEPWKVPQSQVAWPYIGFFALAMVGTFLSH